MLAFCRTEYGAIHVWRGRWAEAEQMLEAGLEDYGRARPAWSTAPLVELAELRRRQGRLEEAEELLGRAEPWSTAQLCRARIALHRGEALEAAELAERVLRQTERRLSRFPACELLVRARIASGELAQAGAALKELRELEQLVGTASLKASVANAAGMLAAAGGDHARARPLFEDAVDGFRGGGSPYEAARARLELATSLAALDRPSAAAHEAETALGSLLELGAEAEVARARRVLESTRRAATPPDELSSRERQVLGLLAEGLTNRQIAERLVVSEHTVHRHVTNILRKLDLPSRTAAATHAVRSGLVEP